MDLQKFSVLDVFQLLGIHTRTDKEEVMVPCPVCGSKRFAMNQRKSIGRCFACDTALNAAGYYGAYHNLSLAESYKEIENSLGLSGESEVPKEKRPERIVFKEAKQSKIAKIEDLDFTYRSFLAELTLSEKNRNGLLARGFNYDDIERLGYKTFPNPSEVDFNNICQKLLMSGCTLEGVPGFYQDKKGNWTFIRMTQGIILPQRTVNNQIFGFQIRKDDDLRRFNEDEGKLEGKCSWFSSKNCTNGCSAPAEVNFSCDFKFDKGSNRYWVYAENEKMVLTEGSLKADLIHALEPKLPVMSVAGVNMYTVLEGAFKYLKKLGIKCIILAYDMDYRTNPHVQNALVKTEEMIKASGLECRHMTWNTHCTIDNQDADILKGLDDYMAYTKKGVIPKIKSFDAE